MIQFTTNRSPWRRIYLQLGGGLVVAALIPTLLRLLVLDPKDFPVLYQTAFGVVGAILLGFWLIRNVTTYPGVKTGAYVIPVFTISYFIMLMVFVLGRLEYNRAAVASGYVLIIVWFVFVNIMVQRSQHLKVGYLPFGEPSDRVPMSGITWIRLEDTRQDVSGMDAIAADLRIDLPSEWDRRVADYALEGIPVFHVKTLVESLTGRVELEHLSENSFGSLVPLSAFMTVKRLVDWTSAAIVGVVLLPVLVLIGIAIKLDSPGPALFRQKRIGFRGKAFTVFKFRTMFSETAGSATADPRLAAMTLEGDARITRLGRFLRRTRIDELPQILNILRGEMSWIGPRPEAEALSRWYETEIPFYRYRHIVRPGLAGWAQVCQGHVSDVADVRSKLHYDFYYIKNFSPWIDLLIIARTVRIVFTGFGSR